MLPSETEEWQKAQERDEGPATPSLESAQSQENSSFSGDLKDLLLRVYKATGQKMFILPFFKDQKLFELAGTLEIIQFSHLITGEKIEDQKI